MTNKRYHNLMESDSLKLTRDEVRQGWHFCYEFDGLLRNSNEEDFKCECNDFQKYPQDGYPLYPLLLAAGIVVIGLLTLVAMIVMVSK